MTHTDTTPTGALLLDVRNVTLAFAGVVALDDVSLAVPTGSLFSVIGPNGAGKTSLFNCLSGVYTDDHHLVGTEVCVAHSTWLDCEDSGFMVDSAGVSPGKDNQSGLFDLHVRLVGRLPYLTVFAQGHPPAGVILTCHAPILES